MEEIDLRVVFARIPARWRLIAAYLMVSSLALSIAVGFYAILSNKVMRYEIKLFGIDEHYPNGVPFNLSDFLEPQILDDLFQSVGLTDIAPEDYLDVLSIQPAMTDNAFIHAKYAARAEEIPNKGDNALATLRQLALDRDVEIAQANRNRYVLQVNYEEFGIDKESAAILLDRWPQIWEDSLVEDYRVVSDLSLKSMALVAESDLGVPENAYYANQQLNFIEANIQKFAGDPRFRRLVSLYGRTPVEVLQGISEYRTVFFTPLYSSVLSIESALSEFYISDHELRIAELDKQIASLQAIVDDITQMEIGVRSRAANGAHDDGDIIQIGDGTLNDIVGLVQKASLQDFLTATLERRHDLVVEKAAIEKQLSQISGNQLLTPEFVSSVSSIHQKLLEEYGDLLKKAEALALDSRVVLFRPDSDAYSVGGRLHPKAKLWPLAPMMGFMFMMFVLVLIPTKQEKMEAKNG